VETDGCISLHGSMVNVCIRMCIYRLFASFVIFISIFPGLEQGLKSIFSSSQMCLCTLRLLANAYLSVCRNVTFMLPQCPRYFLA